MNPIRKPLFARAAILLLVALFLHHSAWAQNSTSTNATPLTFEAVEAGTINIVNPNLLTIEYSLDATTWTSASTDPISISVTAGDKVCFRGDNPAYGMFRQVGPDPWDIRELYTRFTATNDVYVYGNVMSLISSTDYPTLTVLPVAGGPDEFDMDINLAFLFSTPAGVDDWAPISNTTIRNHPTKDILLPAANVTRSGYMYMFSGCEGLTRAPELPATELQWGCYHQMFSNCTNLVRAPELPAPVVPMEGYSWMFNGCTSLNYVKCLATDISVEGCTGGWLTGVAPDGTFVKAPEMNAWTVGPQGEWNEVDGIPAGWMVSNAGEYPVTLPESGIATFSASEDVAIPEGLTAYYCTDYDSQTPQAGTIKVNPVSGTVIPAQTGVLLCGTPGQAYTLTATVPEAPASGLSGNALIAVTQPTHIPPIDGAYTNFMLKNGQFIRVAPADEASMMAANKAYLQIPTEMLPSQLDNEAGVKILWPGDVATGIVPYNSALGFGHIYDLSGRRVSNLPSHRSRSISFGPSASRIFIVNGKKIINK